MIWVVAGENWGEGRRDPSEMGAKFTLFLTPPDF